MKNRHTGRIRRAYGAVISEKYLRKLIRRGSLVVEKEKTASAAIAVIRNSELAALANNGGTVEFTRELGKFRQELCAYFIEKGAVITGCEGETVTAAFGSPLERFAESTKAAYNPVNKAVETLKALFADKTASSKWFCGLDAGECVFGWTQLSGYTAAGSAVLRSQLLSQIASRAKLQALVSKAASSQIAASNVLPITPDEKTPPQLGANELYFRLVLNARP
jgi:class 3 adenylate cyclase